MKKSTRISLLVIMLFLVLTLSACGGARTMYESPIGVEGGVGWVQWIVTRIAELTAWISNKADGKYFVGLIVVTLIVRSIGWPIYAKSNAMTMNMKQAQPELNKIQEKYKGRKDEASQKKQQQETMEVYKKYNINPLGCLLPFLQMPIFIAMYQVVRRIPLTDGFVNGINFDLDMNFLWVNLGDPDPYYILPAIVGILMFFYQRFSMQTPDYLNNKKFDTEQANKSQSQMKYMSYFMVIMLVSIAATNAGIALYWIVGNAFQFVQTYVNRKQNIKKHQEMNSTI
ncbi:MAG: YidC/Oxa1 family membrane protein insertase [Candidatus Izimaplasma sp.]|nr:YidC/Oxa1 family membrane protein insertase [Candidatus Izimaplasma bacterium]